MRLWQIGWFDLKRRFIFGWSISVMQALSSMALLAVSAWLLSRADQRPSVMYLSLAVVGVRAFALGKAFFRYSERLVLHDATFKKATSVRVNIFASLVSRAPIGLRDESVGSILTTLVDDAEDSINRDLRYRPALFQSVAVTVLGVAVYLWLAPDFAWQMAVTLFLGAVMTFVGSKIAVDRHMFELASLRSQLSELSETLVNRAKVIRAYGWQESSNIKLEKLSKKVTKLEYKIAGTSGLLQSFGVLAMYISILVAIGISIEAGDAFPGEQVAVLVLLPLGIFEYLQLIPGAVQINQKARAAQERLDHISNAEVAKEIVSTGDSELASFVSLEILDARVRYPNGQAVSLPNLKLMSGNSISLMAPSGSGKTTLANALVGFIRTSEGKCLVNGAPINSYKPESLAKVFGLVEQSPVILAGSIRDNLLLAKPDATNYELESILRQVGLWETLEKREGLETSVGVKGSKLSGGEAQRLAFARNFLADRAVIILDEPTSSLEQKQGLALLELFFELAKQKNASIILITHDKRLGALTDDLVEF